MTLRKLLLAAAAAIVFASPAVADNITVCAPEIASAAQGPRTVGGANSPVPSQTLYVLNSIGCTRVTTQDFGYFLSQGFAVTSSNFTSTLRTGAATGTTDFVLNMPAKTMVQGIVFSNNTANAVTGGIQTGIAAAGATVAAAIAVGASVDVAVTGALILLPLPVNTGLAYALHFGAVTAWNNADVTISVIATYY